MKKFLKSLASLLCVLALAAPMLAGCDNGEKPVGGGSGSGNGTSAEQVDYAGQLGLDMNSETKKQEVTVKFLIDGDTTHFNPTSNASDFVNGYIRARYLAVNTPESTGVVEKWGKTASNFTHDKLENAEKIIVESDDGNWNVDSTGERYLLWVWYIPKGETKYRNLNIELLQEGYGRSSKTDDNRYGEIASAALYQAQTLKLKIYGNEKDPNYFEGIGEQLTLKYLRFHIDQYIQHPVRVEGVVTAKFASSVYIEEYDEETDVSYGIAVYYGYKTGALLDILSVGNRVNVVGTVGEFNGTYQISDVEYNEARPWLETNTTLLEEGITPPFTERSVRDLTVAGAHPISAEFSLGEDESGEEQFETLTIEYGAAVMDTSVTLKNLTVVDIYTTAKGESKGAMSITCRDESGAQITLRTQVLYKEDGRTLYTAADIPEHIVSVRGIIDYYEGAYQLAVYNFSCFELA